MSTLDTQNAKQIRDAMEVHCGLTARYTNADLAISQKSGDIAVTDSNLSESIDADKWNMRKLADFQGDGFLLDGSCVLLDTSLPGSLDDGKLGIRSGIGGTLVITVTSTQTIPAVTMAITSGEGTVTANNKDYEAERIVVVPVNAKSVTLTVASTDPGRRVEIASITPGVTLELSNENLTYCAVNLRSDLSMDSPSWQISDIEIRAYWPDDISEAISNIGDDVPIWYYAGYPGDYSKTRKFYLSEPAQMEENLITIKGEDQSHKLEDSKNVELQRLDTTADKGRRQLYQFFCNVITGCKIKPVSTETAPSASGSVKTAQSMVVTDQSPRDCVQNIMNLGHYGTFWPTFVDAGIPQITWSKPAKKWDIYERDCGDVVRTVDRNIAKITTDNENGVHCTANRATNWEKLQENITLTKGKTITKSFSDEYYWTYKVDYKSGNKFTLQQLNKVQWVAGKTSVKKKTKVKVKVKGKIRKRTKTIWLYKPTLYGKSLDIQKGVDSISEASKRPGTTLQVNPICYGKIYQGATWIFPDYNRLFERSNIGGSFTWKGDPRMQPRDVASFHRVDPDSNGNEVVELITLESISLIHEGGGTKATISYRKGIC